MNAYVDLQYNLEWSLYEKITHSISHEIELHASMEFSRQSLNESIVAFLETKLTPRSVSEK
jgi:hypothetical protein